MNSHHFDKSTCVEICQGQIKLIVFFLLSQNSVLGLLIYAMQSSMRTAVVFVYAMLARA